MLSLLFDCNILVNIFDYLLKETHVRILRLPGPRILKPWMEPDLVPWIKLEHPFKQDTRLLKCFLLLACDSFTFTFILHLNKGLLVPHIQSLARLAPFLTYLGPKSYSPDMFAFAGNLNHCLALLACDLVGSTLLSAHVLYRVKDLDAIVAETMISSFPEGELATSAHNFLCLFLFKLDLSLSDSHFEFGLFTVCSCQIIVTVNFWHRSNSSRSILLMNWFLYTWLLIKEVFEEVGSKYEFFSGFSRTGSLLVNGVHLGKGSELF